MKGDVEGVAFGVSQKVLGLACDLPQLWDRKGRVAKVAGEVSLGWSLRSSFVNLCGVL